MVESTALEMRHTGNRIVGSNPTLSAILNPWGAKGFPSLADISDGLRRCRYQAWATISARPLYLIID